MEIKTEFLFQDENEKMIFGILASSLKNDLDKILAANQINLSERKKNTELYTTLLQASDKKDLEHFSLDDVSVCTCKI